MTQTIRRTLLLSLALAAAVPSHADEESDWTQYEPPVQAPSAQPATTPEGGYSSSDRDRMGDWMHSGILDRVCRAVALRKGFDFPVGSFAGTGVDVERYLAARPDGRMALVEKQGLRASFGKGFSKEVGGTGASAGLWLSGAISGASYVVRPLRSKEPCEEIFTLADLRQVKSVLPFKGERISAMKVGELWRVPFTLSYTQAASLSDAIEGRGAVTVSFTRADNAAASMTVYRLSEEQTRFRFRIDHVVITSKGGGVSVTIPALEFASQAHNVLLRFVEKEIAHQLAKRTQAWLNYSEADSDGKRALLEFVIDPRDPKQAEALAEAMKGDIGELLESGVRMSTLRVTDESTREKYAHLRDKHAEGLGTPTYSAVNEYKAKTDAWSLNLPFIIQRNSSALFGTDKATPHDGGAVEFKYYRSADGVNRAYLDVPFMGPMVRDNMSQTAEAVTAGAPGQPHGEPILVYGRTQDFVRLPAGAVRGNIDELNRLMALAGAQRADAPRRRLALSPDTIVPPSPPERQATDDRPEWSDRKGYLSFTLVFNQKAVRELAQATEQSALAAFAAAADSSWAPLTQWLARNGRVENGKVVFDQDAARRDFPAAGPEDNDAASYLASLSRQATGLIADLASVKAATTNEARAEAVARLAGGKGKSGLEYERALRVMIQFVDPMDLTGDFLATVKTTSKGVPEPDTHLVLKKDRADVPMLGQAGEVRGRFAEPTLWSD